MSLPQPHAKVEPSQAKPGRAKPRPAKSSQAPITEDADDLSEGIVAYVNTGNHRHDATVWRNRILEIRAANGGDVTGAMVVDDARDPRSPFHAAFEWDDGVAAERYRVAQGWYIIRNVTGVLQAENAEPVIVRAFHRVQTEDGPKTVTLQELREAPAYADAIITAKRGEIASIARQIRALDAYCHDARQQRRLDLAAIHLDRAGAALKP